MEGPGPSFASLLNTLLYSGLELLPLHFLLVLQSGGWEHPHAEIEVLLQTEQSALVIGE